MKPLTPRRRLRLAFAAAGTAAATALLPATAAAQIDSPIEPVVDAIEQFAGGGDDGGDGPVGGGRGPLGGSSAGGSGPNDSGGGLLGGDPLGDMTNPGDGARITPIPELNVVDDVNDNEEPGPDRNPALEVINQDNAEGYETDDPEFPSHAQGEVLDGNAGEDGEIDGAEVTEYNAQIEDDGSANSEVNLFGLFGSEFVSAEASSEGDNEERQNPTEAFCESSGGAFCLNLFYREAEASAGSSGSSALARGGVLALCLGGDDGDALASYECSGPISAGVAEGIGAIQRGSDGSTTAGSANELLNLCLGNSEDPEANFAEDQSPCSGFRASLLHSDSASSTETGETTRNSWLIGFSNDGEEIFRFEDPVGFAIPPGCEDPSLICAFANQGESYIVGDQGEGTGSAQEAAHLDLLEGTPLEISGHSGNAETLVTEQDVDVDGGDEDQPACNDGKDNDGDGLIDLADPGCESPQDDSEADGEAAPECSDGVDNDGDGLIDLADPGCESAADDSEADGVPGKVDGDDEGDELAFTGFNAGPMLAVAFALIGLGALTVAATRRRVGKHVA